MGVIENDLNHDTGGVHIRVRLTERSNDAVAAPLCRSEINKQDLISIVVNDGTQFAPQPDEICSGELAFENRILQMIAVTAHSFENLAQSLFVRNVVANQEGFAHIA